MDGGAYRIVRIKYGSDRFFINHGPVNACCDALTCHVCQFLVHQLSWICSAFADKAVIKPFFDHPLELSE